MKSYTVRLSVSVAEGNEGTYDPPKPVNFSITERLPANVDAERYIKQRLAEEVKRHFAALVAPIDNKTEEAAASEDPLEL